MNFKLKTKLQLYFVVVGIFSVSLTSIIVYFNSKNTLEKISFERLTSTMEIKKKLVENYFDQLKNLTLMLSDNGEIVKSVSRNVKNDNSALLFSKSLKNTERRFSLLNIIVARGDNKEIVFSTSNVNKALLPGIYESIEGSAKLNRGNVFINDFKFYTCHRKPAAFISAPIYNNLQPAGIIMIEFSVDQTNQIMTNNNSWRELGFGETAETYIAGPDFKMRTDSRFFIQEPGKYYELLKKLGTDEKVISLIKIDSTSILNQEVRTYATIEGLKGNALTKIIKDYRGIEVISSFSPLQIGNLKWVIVSEIDTSEAFGTIQSLKEYLILASLIIILLSASIGVAISRKISAPIYSLINAVGRFGIGNLEYRAKFTSNDEFGSLFDTFNEMAEKIMKYTSELRTEIEDRKRIYEELIKSREELRNLSSHLQTVREEERKMIAREIHDELGQALNTLKLKLSLHKRIEAGNKYEVGHSFNELFGLIDKTINTVRKLITELRPQILDDLGLPAAVEWLVNEFNKNSGITCFLAINEDELSVDPDKSIAIFRILQEALTNVARHSKAKTVNISLSETNDFIILSIEDDGIGIPTENISNPSSYGLLGMKERARYIGGEFLVFNNNGHGTSIKVKIHNPKA